MTWLVIGYGNTLRGDDALGVKAIEGLRGRLEGAELAAFHQLTPEVAERLSSCDRAIFLDSSCEGMPGEVRVTHLEPAAGTANLTHHVTPAALLELTETVYGQRPEAWLVTATGASFESMEGLSPQALDAVEEICRIVCEMAGAV